MKEKRPLNTYLWFNEKESGNKFHFFTLYSKTHLMKNLFFLLALVPVLSFSQNRIEHVVYFDTDDATVDSKGMEKVKSLVSGRDVSKLYFLLSGHTDSIGSVQYNLGLSKKREEAVANLLMELGVSATQITSDYNSELRPATSNDAPTGRALNRRVEILMSTDGPFAKPGFGGIYNEGLVHKPFAKVKIPEQRFTIDCDTENRLVTQGGSVITIPANAFVNAFGRVINGSAEVIYREFNTPLEVFVSGIPMHLNRSGERQHFETGGMFDINAVQNGQPLELRDDASIDMDFVSTGNDPGFDFYYMDNDSSGWVTKSDDLNKTTAMDTTGDDIPQAVVRYLEGMGYLAHKSTAYVPLDEQFYTHFPNRALAMSTDKEDQKEYKRLNKHGAYETRVSNVKLPDGKRLIGLDILKYNSSDQNPEWNSFRSLQWKYNGPMSYKEAKKKFHNRVYSDIRVKPGSSIDHVNLELKTTDSIVFIPLKRHGLQSSNPQDPTKQSMAISRDMERRHRAYTKSLANQERKRATEVSKKNEKMEREHQKVLLKVWASCRPLMTETENQMGLEQWVAYCDVYKEAMEALELRRAIASSPNVGTAMVRAITLNKVGIYNIDIIKELKYPEKVKPEFALATDEDIDWTTTYLFDKNLSGVMYSNKSNSNRITLDPRNIQMLVVESSDGKVYRLKTEVIKDMNKRKTAKTTMHVLELNKDVETIEEVRDMLSLGK